MYNIYFLAIANKMLMSWLISHYVPLKWTGLRNAVPWIFTCFLPFILSLSLLCFVYMAKM